MAKVQLSSMLTGLQAMAPSYPSSWPAWEPSSGACGDDMRRPHGFFNVGKIMPLAPFMTGKGLYIYTTYNIWLFGGWFMTLFYPHYIGLYILNGENIMDLPQD